MRSDIVAGADSLLLLEASSEMLCFFCLGVAVRSSVPPLRMAWMCMSQFCIASTKTGSEKDSPELNGDLELRVTHFFFYSCAVLPFEKWEDGNEEPLFFGNKILND